MGDRGTDKTGRFRRRKRPVKVAIEQIGLDEFEDHAVRQMLIMALLHQNGGALRVAAESWLWATEAWGRLAFEQLGEGEAILLRVVDHNGQPVAPHGPSDG